MRVETLVTAWAATNAVVTEHVALADLAEAISDISLEVAGNVDRCTGHQCIGESPAALATMGEGWVAA